MSKVTGCSILFEAIACRLDIESEKSIRYESDNAFLEYVHTCRPVDGTSMNGECEAVIVVDASTLSGRRVRSVQ